MTPRHHPLAIALLIGLAGCGSSDEEAGNSAEAQDVVSVRAVPVEAQALQSWVYGQGTARAVRREFLSFTGEGRVTYVDPSLEIGRRVRRGQLIANLQPERVRSDLVAAQSEFASSRAAQREAGATLDVARVALERFRTLRARGSASPQEFDQARAEYEQALAAKRRADAQATANSARVDQQRVIFSETRLVSPINGVLARLNVERGRLFSPQAVQANDEQSVLRSVPAVVIDPSSFEITAELPATRFREIRVGSEVLVGIGQEQAGAGAGDERYGRESGPPLRISAYRVRGRVHAIGASLDPETRTVQVIVRTTTPNPQLQDGEFVALWIARPVAGQMPTIPLDTVRYRNDRPFVFVVDAQRGIARERPVRLGAQGGGRHTVLEGLRVGERVVTEGRSQINDEQRIRILPPRREGGERNGSGTGRDSGAGGSGGGGGTGAASGQSK